MNSGRIVYRFHLRCPFQSRKSDADRGEKRLKGKKSKPGCKLRNWMCKSGSNSISATCSESFLHWLHIIDKCNMIDRTWSIRMKQVGWLVSSIWINTQTHSQQSISSLALFISHHFFPFLSISELMGKNGNVAVSQAAAVLISGAGVPFPQWWKHVWWQMSPLVSPQTASQSSQWRIRILVDRSVN